MEKKTFKIEAADNKERIDKYLSKALDNKISRAHIQNLISSKLVLLNTQPVNKHYKLKAGDLIEVSLPDKEPIELKPEAIGLDVIHEDSFILVINKPAGLITHPAPGRQRSTLVNALLNYTDKLSDSAGPYKPGIVHRLDKDTSGLIVIARDNRSHAFLAGQFKARSVKRIYTALVAGRMQFDNGVINAPIGRDTHSKKRVMSINYESTKDAITHYRVLERFAKSTLLELDIKTGRTHQIRVHLKHIGYPIIGDALYGFKKDAPRQMLHANLIGFVHPDAEKYVEYQASLPDKMQAYIEKHRQAR